MSSLRFAVSLFLFASLSFGAGVKTGVAAKNIQTVKFQSDSLGEQRAFNILLPLDYDSSTHHYPVLYLLHGYGDDNTAWSYMTNLSAYGAEHEIIIVMPDGSKSWYVNNAANPKEKFEDYIVKDLIGYVDSHYRTLPLPRSRAVAGLSMGGYGAVFLGFHNYTKFAAIGTFSGAVGSEARKDRDPFALAAKVPAAEMPMIYVACGGEDFLVKQNRDFVAFLADKKIPYEYREVSPRVHSWDFWNDQIQIFLDKLDKLPGFKQP